MKHASIRELFDYWNARRGRRSAPERAEIEPGAIRRVLADTFILSFEPNAGHPFRIAGTRVCALFNRELKGEAFLDLWSIASRADVRDLAAIVADESVGVVASATGRRADEPGSGRVSPARSRASSDALCARTLELPRWPLAPLASAASAGGAPLRLELLLLPLRHGQTDARFLGALVPCEVPAWLGTSALTGLVLGTHRYVGEAVAPLAGADRRLPRAALASGASGDPKERVKHGFTVYEGGQS